MSDAFEKIAIVIDRDNREVSAIETEAAAFLKVPCGTIKNNQWNDCSYTNEFGMEKSFSTLLVDIPHEQQGALETAMLAAIAEDPYDKSIVEKTGAFASRMREEASRYISTDRLKLKAHLGLTWAVQYKNSFPELTSRSEMWSGRSPKHCSCALRFWWRFRARCFLLKVVASR